MRVYLPALLFCLLAPVAAQGDTSSLLQTRAALAATGDAIAQVVEAAEATAAALGEGGQFWLGGHPALVSEFSGRAGGLMVLKPLRLEAVKAGDAVFYASGGRDDLDEQVALLASGATIIWAGAGTGPDGGLQLPVPGGDTLSPTLSGAAAGWVYLAEVIAALTRHGRMPVLYETIGGYGGYQRIAAFDAKGIYWHETHLVPPVPPATLGPIYIAAVTACLERVDREMGPRLAQIGRQVAEARAGGHRTIMYSMGHLFPHEVEETALATLFESAVWNAGFMAQPVPDDTYAPGDMVIHIGYQHPPYRLLPRVRDGGARAAYVSVLQHRDFPQGDGSIWIDPMWPWADGVVPLPNYDVPACPASGVVNAAIAWEIYRQSLLAMGPQATKAE